MAALELFGKMLAHARDAYALTASLAHRFERDASCAHEPGLERGEIDIGAGWFMLWESADLARKIAGDLGRDTTAYDALRAQLRSAKPDAVTFKLSNVHPTTFPPGQKFVYVDSLGVVVLYILPELDLAAKAINILANLVPEAVVPGPEAPDATPVESLAPSRLPWIVAAGALAVGIVVAIVMLR